MRAYSGIPEQGPLDEATAKLMIHGYYASVSFVDAQIVEFVDLYPTMCDAAGIEQPAQLEGTCLVTRQSVQTAAAVRKAKKMLRKAFENSMAGKGTSIVEFVSTCSSGWKMTPEKANKWMEENMIPFYPLGDLKNKE